MKRGAKKLNQNHDEALFRGQRICEIDLDMIGSPIIKNKIIPRRSNNNITRIIIDDLNSSYISSFRSRSPL